MKNYLKIFVLFSFVWLNGQNASIKQTDCDIAKEMSSTAAKKQGAKESQELFDQAITLCPNYDYAYFEKSVPYLKRGKFIEWKKLIDQAVALNPKEHLGYRGWSKFQFLRDYKGALNDINKLDSLVDYDIGFSQNGNYHLNIVKGLCYKMMGEKEKAIKIFEAQMEDKFSIGIYDYLHLGVLYLEIGDFHSAIENFINQIQENDYLAETYYYMSIAYERLGNKSEATSNIIKAKEMYEKEYFLFDPYTHPIDKVYLSEITNRISLLTDK